MRGARARHWASRRARIHGVIERSRRRASTHRAHPRARRAGIFRIDISPAIARASERVRARERPRTARDPVRDDRALWAMRMRANLVTYSLRARGVVHDDQPALGGDGLLGRGEARVGGEGARGQGVHLVRVRSARMARPRPRPREAISRVWITWFHTQKENLSEYVSHVREIFIDARAIHTWSSMCRAWRVSVSVYGIWGILGVECKDI